MGGLLNDAAGGSRRAVLALRQVGQGHGCIDLPPVCLISALHLLLLRHSDTSAAPDGNEHSQGKNRRERREPLSGTTDAFMLYNFIFGYIVLSIFFKAKSVMHYNYGNYCDEYSRKIVNTKHNSLKLSKL